MYEALKAALEQTGIPMAEGDWDRAPKSGNYMTLRLEREASSLWGDNHQQAQTVEGTVDLFARSLATADVDEIQRAFDRLEISWKLYSTQYEPRNHIVHYEWLYQLENRQWHREISK